MSASSHGRVQTTALAASDEWTYNLAFNSTGDFADAVEATLGRPDKRAIHRCCYGASFDTPTSSNHGAEISK